LMCYDSEQPQVYTAEDPAINPQPSNQISF